MIAQILIADDDSTIIGLLQSYLTAKKHRVIVVSDGSLLIQKAQEHQPHLIISDIQMPGVYGTRAYQLLASDPRTAKIPILFISAHPRERLASLLPDDPKTRFVRKPFPLPEIDKLIGELLPMGGYIP